MINFDGPNSGPVREFFVTNGRYWIEEFHFDGFRFDATHAIRDQSKEYIIGAVGRAAREAAGSRSIILVAENDLQEARMTRPQNEGGDGLDGMWNDDFHHSAIVALTGQNVGYFSDYSGKPQEFISAAKYGFLYQGQALSWRKVLRGTPTFGIPAEAFVCFIENHDQIANTGPGDRPRFQTSPGRYRAMTALLLLGPWTPLLFQGQEFGASSPFLFFADVGDAAVRDAIRKGRAELLAPFLSLTEEETLRSLPAPDDPEAFSRCKLDFSEREKNRELYDLHIDLLKLRRDDSRFRQQSCGGIDGAVLGPTSFVLRYFSEANDDRLLLVNLRGTPGFASCFGAFTRAAGRLQMGNALDERFASLRRSGSRCNRNSGAMDFASRVDGGITAGAQGVTASGSRRSFETSLQALHSHRITSADENRLGHSRIRFNARVCICTGGTDTDTRIHTAAESLSCRVAELRRGDRYAIADFFGQQRFRARKDRRKNGRIFSESAHLIQARAGHAEDRRGRSMDARSGAGDLHDLHDQRRRPETGRRRSGRPRRAGKIKMAALHIAARIRRRAVSFR